jgi:tetratricopeptide (TPR) repeat protein
MFPQALEQVQQAIRITGNKPLLTFYMSAIYFAMGKSKEGLLHLERALSRSPKLLKKMLALNPSLLQSQAIVDVIARHRKR